MDISFCVPLTVSEYSSVVSGELLGVFLHICWVYASVDLAFFIATLVEIFARAKYSKFSVSNSVKFLQEFLHLLLSHQVVKVQTVLLGELTFSVEKLEINA